MAVTASPPSMNGSWFQYCNEPFNLPDLPSSNFDGLQAMADVVSTPSHADIEPIDRGSDVQIRSEYVSKQLAGIPKCFVEQAQTSFIHRSLMQSRPDPALQDALSVAALYFLRNDSNRLLAIRNLEHKARQLIATTNLQAISRARLLAAAQALLVYQLIRLFDGDIRLRAQAEADEAFLSAWVDHLRSDISLMAPNNLNSETGQNSLSTRDWQSWLFEESTRRTIIVSMLLKGIYHFLKTGRDTEQDLRLTFNAHASLWSAQSQQSWLAKRNDGQDLQLRVVHWNEDITKATPEDLDELGVQIMAMLWGVGATQQWLGGSYLSRHGFQSA
ncbi:hypothetical protein CB0940_06436 [Cercospora beticola]|uniref:Transcription factor gsfR2 n=1 Tax=Cercospora beticola TaxID=122368 RepID=A0A2G5HZU4_CERBT|nr:hypothetical protein CB0940_06436 [Cercospora beticola]PIA98031.1 hypothetical protein CB0940_06436 [Cercospora beticola]WPA99072.1 hypothetical protein RHO25_003687 [Cercospora beticola]